MLYCVESLSNGAVKAPLDFWCVALLVKCARELSAASLFPKSFDRAIEQKLKHVCRLSLLIYFG